MNCVRLDECSGMPGARFPSSAATIRPLLPERCSHLQHVVACLSSTRDLHARSCSHVSLFRGGLAVAAVSRGLCGRSWPEHWRVCLRFLLLSTSAMVRFSLCGELPQE